MKNQIPGICELESELEDIVFSACGKRLYTLITGKFQVYNCLDGSILPGCENIQPGKHEKIMVFPSNKDYVFLVNYSRRVVQLVHLHRSFK